MIQKNRCHILTMKLGLAGVSSLIFVSKRVDAGVGPKLHQKFFVGYESPMSSVTLQFL